jgi:hypothetical protein
MKFITKTYNKHIAEEEQDLEVQFAFARKSDTNTFHNISDFSVCRDFLGDVVVANVTNKPSVIYGFKYDPETQAKLDLTHTYLALKSSPEVLEQFKVNLKRFRSWWEIMVGNNYCNIIEVDNPEILVVQCNPWWQKTTVGISYLSFILKALCWDYDEDASSDLFTALLDYKHDEGLNKEARYIKALRKEAGYLLINLEKLTDAHTTPHGYPVLDQYINNVHNNSGFYFAIRWKRDTIAGKFVAEMK